MKLVQLSVASIVACLAGLLILLGFGLYSLQQMRAKQDQVAELLVLQKRIDDISVASDRFLLHRPDDEIWRAYRDDVATMHSQLMAYENTSADARRAARQLEMLQTEVDAVLSGEVPSGEPAGSGAAPLGIPKPARDVMRRVADHGAALDAALDRLLRNRQQLIAREATWIAAGFAGVALLFSITCVLAFTLIYRRISGPARMLEQRFQRLADGDRGVRLPVTGSDEFARLSETVNHMLDRRQQIENRLQEYCALVEGSRNLHAVIDASHRYVLINRAYQDAYGFDPDAVTGQHVRDLVGADFYEREVRHRFDRVLAGETVEFETRRDYRDRGQCNVLIRYYPIPSDDGHIERIGASVTDITALKQAEAELREQARLLDMAGHAARFGGWSADLASGRITLSKVAAEIRGQPEVTEQTIEDGLALYAPEWHDPIWHKFHACATGGIPYDEEVEIITPQEKRTWVRIVGEPVRDDENRIIRVEGAFQDITERKKSELEAERLSRRLATMLESITDAFIAIDHEWRFSYVNFEAEQVIGRTSSELLGLNVWDEYPDIADMAMGRAYRRAMEERETVAVEDFYPPLGKWFDIRAYPSEEGLAVFFRDVTERHEMIETLRAREQELQRIAHEDPVSGALTRHGFVEAFRRHVESSGWQAAGMIIMLDIEGQRDINDAHGYEAGDQVLIQTAKRLRKRAGDYSIVARTGGDEFVVFVPPHSRGKSRRQRHTLAAVFEKPFRVKQQRIEVGARFGYTLLGESTREPDHLLREAELALFEAHTRGPGEWFAYTSDLDRAAQERVEMTGELRRALEEGQFELHFQPKVELDSGRLISCEALLRWIHPQRGLISPAQFIPVAEQSQLMGPIGDWALFEACRLLREWRDAGLEVVRIAVNVSLVQFRLGRFVDRVREAIAAHGIDPGGLTLEITESVFEQESEMLRNQLRDLHKLGVRLSLDDFGTGYSSLLYLQQYPFDEIKIDQGFVQQIPDDPYSCKIVTTVLGIAGALDADAVAEGVESEAMRDALLAMGCRHGQGYYYSVPLKVEDFRWLLEKRSVLPLSSKQWQKRGGRASPGTVGK